MIYFCVTVTAQNHCLDVSHRHVERLGEERAVARRVEHTRHPDHALNMSVRDIQAMVLGGHGDTMVPLISYTSVSGIPITQLMERSALDAIVDRTRNGGAEIVKHLKTGSAYYAPSAGAVQMAEAIVNDQRRILPCAAWLQGEYGMKDLFLGVPCLLGRKGLERVIEVELTADERAALQKSADAVREPMAAITF